MKPRELLDFLRINRNGLYFNRLKSIRLNQKKRAVRCTEDYDKKISLRKNVSELKFLRTLGLISFILLLLSGSRYSLQFGSISGTNSEDSASEQPIPISEIQRPDSNSFFAIETNSFSQIFSQVNRFPASSVLTNKVVPVNFSFRNIFNLPLLINFNSPVPIFIKGHVLRH